MDELHRILFIKKLKKLRFTLLYGAIVLLACVALYFIFFYHTHSFSDWERYIEPSCNKNGFERKYCSCGEYEQRMLEKLPHTEGEWKLNEKLTANQLLCSVCEAVLKSEPYIPHNHAFGDWEILTEPKCELEGLRTRTCECGETESNILDALEHIEGMWTLDGITMSFPCTVCGKVLRTEELEASSGLLVEDGILLGIGSCTDSDIILPRDVVSIADGAFLQSTTIESIYIPETVKSIGDKAFYNCRSLLSIVFANGVERIGDQAFYNCISLKEIELPKTLTELGERAFSYCDKLQSVTIPSSLTYLDMWSFSYCEKLSSIHFDGTVAQWETLPKDSEWNMGTNSYTVYCTDGNIKK